MLAATPRASRSRHLNSLLHHHHRYQPFTASPIATRFPALCLSLQVSSSGHEKSEASIKDAVAGCQTLQEGSQQGCKLITFVYAGDTNSSYIISSQETGARYKEISSQLLRYPYMRCHPIRNPHTPKTPCSRLVGNDLPLHEMCAESCSLTGSCTNYCFFAGSRRGDCSLISMLKAPKPRFSKLDILRAVHHSARLTQPRVLLKAVIRKVVATKHRAVFPHYLHTPQ
ncbi:hypothetical protein FALCPG4_011868 [Fusarium falciforme]